MLNCEIHGAQDLRLTEVAPEALGPAGARGREGRGHLRLGPALLPARQGGRLRHPRTADARPRASGQVLEVGAAVTRVKPGDRVALDPARTCGVCRYCRQGDSNHCEAVHFSAAPALSAHAGRDARAGRGAGKSMPAGAGQPVLRAGRFRRAAGGGAARGAQRRHAAGQDGDGGGRRPHRGAGRDGGPAGRRQPRHRGGHRRPDAGRLRAVGATRTINAATDPGALDELAAGKGTVDVCFEASGNYAGLANCIRAARRAPPSRWARCPAAAPIARSTRSWSRA